MSTPRSTLLMATWFLISSAAKAGEPTVPDPLFQSDELMHVRIVAPIDTLLKTRPIDDDLAATLHFVDTDDTKVDLDIGIRTRGKFRRREDVCRFPPMRLNFKKSTVAGTSFHNQDKLKLVTHCEPTTRYAQALLREYLAYRMLNVVTDVSYKVRLLRITYVDSDARYDDETYFGIVIEHKRRLAERLGKQSIDVPRSRIANLDAAYTNVTSVFQFLIGNTDFSPIMAPPGDNCCHNHVLYGNEGEKLVSVPYDFDQSGIVNAPHAAPGINFKIRNVRQRLYRGRCANNDYIAATIALFLERRDLITSLVNELRPLTSRTRNSVLKYVEGFYKTIESERRVTRALLDKCI